jgi:hypothetical protein
MLEIEGLVRQVEELADEGARECARALVRAVLELHAGALARIVDQVRRASGEDALRELARDDAVGCVLSLHGIYEVEPARPPPMPPPPSPDTTLVPVERLLAGRTAGAAKDHEGAGRTGHEGDGAHAGSSEEPERCDLCSAPVGERHEHLVDPQSRELRCACGPCASLFGLSAEGRWKRVRHRADRLDAFRLEDASWNALGIPIDLAFFFRSSRDQRVVAMYPSPAGATESLLSLDAWTRVERDNPVLGGLEADVEALLVRRGRRVNEHEHYRVSIDACYALVGRIRKHWKGLGGGTDVWQQIGAFFDDLRSTAAVRSLHA